MRWTRARNVLKNTVDIEIKTTVNSILWGGVVESSCCFWQCGQKALYVVERSWSKTSLEKKIESLISELVSHYLLSLGTPLSYKSPFSIVSRQYTANIGTVGVGTHTLLDLLHTTPYCWQTSNYKIQPISLQLNAYKGFNSTHFRISLHIFDNVHTSL